jgi:hypothetical protein
MMDIKKKQIQMVIPGPAEGLLTSEKWHLSGLHRHGPLKFSQSLVDHIRALPWEDEFLTSGSALCGSLAKRWLQPILGSVDKNKVIDQKIHPVISLATNSQ